MDTIGDAWYAVENARRKLLKVVPEIEWKEWGTGPSGELKPDAPYWQKAALELLGAIDSFYVALR